MLDQETRRLAPAIVTLPGQIDLTNADLAYDRLYAALASGAPVVVADFTATTFCDCSSLRRLASVRDRAAARNAELRLAIPPGGPVRRLATLIGLEHLPPVYPGAREAAGGPLADLDPPGPHWSAGRTTVMADITGLIGASHLHILRWQARLGELRLGSGPASRPGLAAAWGTAACLIDLHLSADEEVCGPALHGTGPQRVSLTRQAADAHEDIRELLRETSLQPPGSPRWHDLATAALSAWARHCDQEEHGPPAERRRRAGPALRGQLAGQWRAYREAWIRDRYPDVAPGIPTCQLRQGRPATPRLADPAFSPLACTCQDCTRRLSQAFRPLGRTSREEIAPTGPALRREAAGEPVISEPDPRQISAGEDRRLAMGEALTIRVRRERGYAVLVAAGEIDIATAPGCASACPGSRSAAAR